MSGLLAAAQLILPVAAQTTLPALGDGAEMSLSAERQLGDRIARELYRDTDYIDDAILSDYVQGIWARLMTAARQRGELTPELDERFAWQLLLGRDRSVNAFALPGGYMGVHLGLIAVVSSEDELASVLAHELSHITQRHIARMLSQQSNQAPWLLGAIILGVLAGIGNPSAGGAMIVGGQAAAVQGQLNFSRDMEREADRVGYGVMTQAGFDGRGFVTMFEKLEQANRFNDTSAYPYLRSHPLTTERIADMQARQQLQPTVSQRPMTLLHALMTARARVLVNQDADSLRLALNLPDTSGYSALPRAQQAGALYASVLAARQQREFDQARRRLDRLTKLVEGDEMATNQVRLLGAELALAAGAPQEALDRLANTKDGVDTMPRATLLLSTQGRIQTGGARDAAERLQVWLATRSRDAQAWQQLSAAYAQQGQTLRALRAEAEAHASRLDYAAARDRLKAAQDLARQGPTPDHIEASIIDTRSRQIESMLREQSLER